MYYVMQSANNIEIQEKANKQGIPYINNTHKNQDKTMVEPRNKNANTNGTTATKKKIRTPLLDRSNNKNVVNDEKPKKMSRFQELFMKSAKNTTVVYEDGLQKANQQKRNFEKSKDDIQNSIKDDQVRLVLSTKFVKQRKKSSNRMSNNSTSSLLLKKKEKNFQVIEKKKSHTNTFSTTEKTTYQRIECL